MMFVIFRKHARVDMLINNAGVLIPPQSRTEQGFDVTIGTYYYFSLLVIRWLFILCFVRWNSGTNVMGPSYLTNALLPLVAASEHGGRIVFLASSSSNDPDLATFQACLSDVGGENLTESTFKSYQVCAVSALLQLT